jgi:hypothetical protein
MEKSPLPVKGCKFRPMLGTLGLWAGKDLYHATPAVTWGLGFSGLIQRTAPFSHLLQHAWGCGGHILTRILTGCQKIKIATITGTCIYFGDKSQICTCRRKTDTVSINSIGVKRYTYLTIRYVSRYFTTIRLFSIRYTHVK